MKSPNLSQMSSQVPFIIILFTSGVAQIPTAYELLQKYDFPVGLLPTSVTSYILNNATGEFLVTLSDKCSFSTDGYDLQFKPTISGVIIRQGNESKRGKCEVIVFLDGYCAGYS